MWIFLSHGTALDDVDGRRRLEDLRTALMETGGAATGHDVLLDFKRLEPAAKWHVQLDEWLTACHAAILMLTPRALTSSWVLKEATILAHRAARDSKFLLFPVLLDGVSSDQLSANDSPFSPVYLDLIQRLKATDPLGIAAGVLLELQALATPCQTPFDRLVSALTSHLEGASEPPLEHICASITGERVSYIAAEKRSHRCAREIARAIVTGRKGSYVSLRDLIGDLLLAGVGKERAERILNLAAPLWVDHAAAAPLADIAARNLSGRTSQGQPRPSWSTAMNGEFVPQFTADMYLRRAYSPETVRLRTIDGGEGENRLEELVARIRTEIRDSTLGLRGTKDAKVDAFLAALTGPYFVLLPRPLPDPELLAALQQRYPKLTFIAHADEDVTAQDLIGTRVVLLWPPVDPTKELDALTEYNDASDRIKSA